MDQKPNQFAIKLSAKNAPKRPSLPAEPELPAGFPLDDGELDQDAFEPMEDE